jgi:3-isopropylmalate/(R)-2-methylmalate dehydratase large subunit
VDTHLTLSGRILFLSADPEKIEAQLKGANLTLEEARPLRDEISTDEISPITTMVHYDERLGRLPYTGFKAGDRRPISADAIKAGGFVCTVAGTRYGKGSSREHSPLAEHMAGIRLVVAESFERIYRQNADNLGLFTLTDFDVLEQIRLGEPIPVTDLVRSREDIEAAVLRAGGLLHYGQQRMRSVVAKPLRVAHPTRYAPQTLLEKILVRYAVRTEDFDGTPVVGKGCFVRADWRFIHEYYTGLCSHMLHKSTGKPIPLVDPSTIVAFEDHLSYSHRSPAHSSEAMAAGVRSLSQAHRDFVADYGIRSHGYLAGSGGSEGISHAVMAEQYALPGQLIVGTDSHTPHIGAVGCLAIGIGTTDIANAMITGAARIRVPETLRVELTGRIPAGVTAKDIVLHLLAQPTIRAGQGVGKAFEFAGPSIVDLSIDERATLTNMTAELGGFTGWVEADDVTVRFLRERRGVDFRIEPWMRSDVGARYADVIRIDCASISPMVASPGDPGNGIPLPVLDKPVKVDIAYGGSCTAGKREDFDYYHKVLGWASERGLRVPSHVKLYLQFGTVAVRDYCIAKGYLEAFEKVGAEMLQPACGACANCGPGSSTETDQVTISAINRNFPGRSGPGQVWLASPLTVAASAIAGEIVSFDQLLQRNHA